MTFVKGQSGNPGGRVKLPEAFRDRCKRAVDEHVIDAWIEEVESRGDNWVKCSELLSAYGLGKPAQSIELGAADNALRISIEVAGVDPERKNKG